MPPEEYIVQNAHMAAEFQILKSTEYPLPGNLIGLQAGQVLSLQQYPAVIRGECSGDHVEQSCFPRSVGSYNRLY